MSVSTKAFFRCGVLLLLIGCQLSQSSTDRKDQAALVKQCQIPEYAVLEQYHGFPASNGFGQREGLRLSAKFRIPAEQSAAFEREASEEASEWAPLPIPSEILQRIPFKLSIVNLTTKKGFYRCRTAGDNVLYARETSTCATPRQYVKDQSEPPRWRLKEVPLSSVESYSDLIISVYDKDSKSISAAIVSGY